MCTVSFIPLANNDFVFTSNRDEAIGRSTLIPDFYEVDDTKIWIPKDEISGGTWIGVTDEKRLVCLLNGGFEFHVKQANYRHSRGVVVRDFLTTKNVDSQLKDYDLNNIEPFTLIIVEWENELKISELVWDGEQKHISNLPLKSKIWNSSTLYSEEMKVIRQQWFQTYLKENNKTQESILNFHQHFGVGDKDIDLQIDRGILKTVSITSVSKNANSLNLKYIDLLNDKMYTSTMQNQQTKLVHA